MPASNYKWSRHVFVFVFVFVFAKSKTVKWSDIDLSEKWCAIKWSVGSKSFSGIISGNPSKIIQHVSVAWFTGRPSLGSTIISTFWRRQEWKGCNRSLDWSLQLPSQGHYWLPENNTHVCSCENTKIRYYIIWNKRCVNAAFLLRKFLNALIDSSQGSAAILDSVAN